MVARGSPPGWTCVTGSWDDIEQVRRFPGFTDPDPLVDGDRSQHGSLVAMGNDPSGRWHAAATGVGAQQLANLALRIWGKTTSP